MVGILEGEHVDSKSFRPSEIILDCLNPPVNATLNMQSDSTLQFGQNMLISRKFSRKIGRCVCQRGEA